jgi:glycine/D-amino acid oxidase-like deaminating enzyme
VRPLPPPRAAVQQALLYPDDGAVHPARWVRRLTRAIAAGAKSSNHARADDELDAETVVVAVDGLTATLCRFATVSG